jgi:hypothetical protein
MFRAQRFVKRPSPAAVRIQLDTHIDGNLSVSILKRRGGWASGPVYLDTSLQHGALALHSRATAAAGCFQSRRQ